MHGADVTPERDLDRAHASDIELEKVECAELNLRVRCGHGLVHGEGGIFMRPFFAVLPEVPMVTSLWLVLIAATFCSSPHDGALSPPAVHTAQGHLAAAIPLST